MNATILYRSGELTPHGDPILCHFGPGCTIAPHERQPETKTVVTIHGQKFTVKGHWKDISKQAGYGDIVEETAKPVSKPTSKASEPTSKKPDKGGGDIGDLAVI